MSQYFDLVIRPTAFLKSKFDYLYDHRHQLLLGNVLDRTWSWIKSAIRNEDLITGQACCGSTQTAKLFMHLCTTATEAVFNSRSATRKSNRSREHPQISKHLGDTCQANVVGKITAARQFYLFKRRNILKTTASPSTALCSTLTKIARGGEADD